MVDYEIKNEQDVENLIDILRKLKFNQVRVVSIKTVGNSKLKHLPQELILETEELKND